jgi:hypothetical protein
LSLGADWGCDPFLVPDFLVVVFAEKLLLLLPAPPPFP